ncbi:MAG: aminotransferase class III-fold pyridoxal phosphate-dependent enzyme [Armatimonadetes bacterium]|nr:aminotransferase class III-fold pyridoxal phosphate-dependent enzyme [Armatimonadota bacterium]
MGGGQPWSIGEVSVRELTRRHVLVPWASQASLPHPVIDHGEGCWLYGPDGNRYLDLSSGLINVNVGHAHPHVVAAIERQARRVAYVVPSFATDVRALLAEKLAQYSPQGKLTKVFFTSGGAEANENAVKMARLFTGRHKILTAYRSYHGATYGAVTLSGDNRRWAVEPGIPGVVHFFAPYPYRSPFRVPPEEQAVAALAHLEEVLLYEGPHTVAAMILEPIVGSDGLIVPPDGYLQGVRQICDRHGILLILDEVMAGFGRTGRWFAAEHWNVVPDMITLAKGVTAGYVPLGGVLVHSRIASYFDDHVLWGGLTYSGHALACAAGMATLEVYEQEGLIERAARMEAVLRGRLEELARRHPIIGDVRGKGLFFGVELVKDRATKEPWVPWNSSNSGPTGRLLSIVMQKGVYLFGRWNMLFVAPPLTIREDELDFGIRALDEALSAVEP